MINLNAYPAVRSALFVRIQVDEYRTTPSGAYTQEILTFSDHDQSYTINGEEYLALGRLASVSPSNSEIRPSGDTVTVAISGIPNSSIAEIVNSKIKGAPVIIYRGFFNPSTGALIGELQGRFRGFVNNYSLEEDHDVFNRVATNTISIECSSSIGVLNRKFAGRMTNPQSMRQYFPTDASFDRVPTLENTTFDFGKP